MTKAATNDPVSRIEQQKKYDAALAEARRLSAAAAEASANVDRAAVKTDVPSAERYRLAVREFRAAYAQLAAEDRRADRQGFGEPIHPVDLRHALANPDEGGSLADDVERALRVKTPLLLAAEEADRKAADAHAKAAAIAPGMRKGN
jgi:hypothetical protein